MRARPVVCSLLLVVGLMLVAAFALLWHPAIAPAQAPESASLSKARIERGRVLASLGFCSSCHTAESGRAFAGGRPLPTPFGTINATNITPDPETGLGGWSLAAFTRAMRRGIGRDGRQLYPAFPYSHFTHLTDDDIAALYAFLMTRPPVRAATPANRLRFPFNLRPLVAFWNLLFLREGPLTSDRTQDAVWNRGHYLSEALSHCGACHSPRNALGAEVSDKAYAGGEVEGWWAPPLDGDSPAPVPWTVDSLFAYLRSWSPDHGAAAGPMAPVVTSLAQAPEDDVRAIATYVASLQPKGAEARAEALVARAGEARFDTLPGAAIYAGACAVCHESGGSVPYTLRSLALHTAVQAPDPRDVIRAVVDGIKPPEGTSGPFMPPFAGTLDARQIGDVVAYVRARFSEGAAWTGTDATIHAALAGGPQ